VAAPDNEVVSKAVPIAAPELGGRLESIFQALLKPVIF